GRVLGAGAGAFKRVAARNDLPAQIAGLTGGAAEFLETIVEGLKLVEAHTPILDRHVIRDRTSAVARKRVALEHEIDRQEAPVVPGPMHTGAADALARRERAPAPHRQRLLARKMPEGDSVEGRVLDELGAARVTQFVADRRQDEIVAWHAVRPAFEADHAEPGLGEFARQDRAGPAHPHHDRIDFFQARSHGSYSFASPKLGASLFPPYSSATNPDAFTTGPQRAMSARTRAANSSGGWNIGSLPNLARFSASSGDLIASPIAVLSALKMSG